MKPVLSQPTATANGMSELIQLYRQQAAAGRKDPDLAGETVLAVMRRPHTRQYLHTANTNQARAVWRNTKLNAIRHRKTPQERFERDGRILIPPDTLDAMVAVKRRDIEEWRLEVRKTVAQLPPLPRKVAEYLMAYGSNIERARRYAGITQSQFYRPVTGTLAVLRKNLKKYARKQE